MPRNGPAIRAGCNEKLVVGHSFPGRVQAYAVSFNPIQAARQSGGRTSLCRSNVAVNNIFFQCPRRINLGRREENRSDRNCFDLADDSGSLGIQHPEPASRTLPAGRSS